MLGQFLKKTRIDNESIIGPSKSLLRQQNTNTNTDVTKYKVTKRGLNAKRQNTNGRKYKIRK